MRATDVELGVTVEPAMHGQELSPDEIRTRCEINWNMSRQFPVIHDGLGTPLAGLIIEAFVEDPEPAVAKSFIVDG